MICFPHKQMVMSLVAGLVAAPAAAAVTFDGAWLYSGSGTFYTDQQHVYSPIVSLAVLGNAGITNDNDSPAFGPGNAASVHTVMAVNINPTGSLFKLDGTAVAAWTGDPGYIVPGGDSDNQFRYYFTLDTPFDLDMAYSASTDYTLNSDYYSAYAGFDGLHVSGGVAADRSDSGSLFQYNATIHGSGTVNLHLLPGVYTLSLNGFVSAKTYHPGFVSATTHSVFTTNLNPVGGVPEPANWALLIAGFGLIGAAQRRRRYRTDYQGSVLPV